MSVNESIKTLPRINKHVCISFLTVSVSLCTEKIHLSVKMHFLYTEYDASLFGFYIFFVLTLMMRNLVLDTGKRKELLL